ncbi:autotransporter-associated beta strand repeat-containing protein [Comamonas terrigena]|uniref:autotransporter-associated beta strand repeat-containing protein n=1 Tax=Comamonas terrigena TaxID=32013 RepID=UPI0028A6A3F3|nr:autotransporter-associated beta strand repeat-containing protein [Comamonas terrigena]
MNRIYRSIWNATLGAWVAAPETARTGGSAAASTVEGHGKSPADRLLVNWRGIAGAIAIVCGSVAATPAHALCTTVGSTISCTGITVGLVTSTSNLTVNVQNGAQIYPGVVDAVNAVSLTGTGITVNNAGRIDPSLLPGLVSLASGLNLSNAAGSTVLVNNLSTGQIMGTSSLLGANLLGLGGIGLVVQNGAGGTTTVNNTGLISGTALLSAAVLPEDMAVVALRGGARNVLTNNAGGTITGRVAMQASTLGNVFTNVGTVTGSVNLGAGSGANTFNAVTGSVFSGGAGVGVDLGVLGGLGLAYAPTGIVNAGALNNGNTLNLMNAIGGGSGTAGSGVIDGSKYINFNKLNVQSGTWTMTNQLFAGGSSSTEVQLNGGVLNVDANALNGAATVTANGGGLGAASSNVTIGKPITLDTNGLTVTGSSNALTLSGELSGSGALTKTGTGTVTLSGVNTYTGGTTLAAGTLTLGHAGALSAQALNVNGASTLSTTSAMTVGNDISLNGANLTVNSSSAQTLSGAINGTGSLTKTGSADLTLSGANSFGGGLNINAGKLILANAGATGGGTITAGVVGTGALDTSTAQTLTNLIQLNGNLTLTGSNDLTLAGKISGTGGLNKAGLNTLTLSGANDFTGNSTLAGGTLVLQNNTALGTGQLTLSSNSTLDASGLSIGNAINVGTRVLTLSNTAATTLSGALSGTGAIIKNGAGDLTLSGSNTFAGVLSLASGKLIVGSNTALGNGSLQAGANTTLDADAARSVSTNVVLLGNLNIAGSNDLALNSQITGVNGNLTKNGASTLTLGGDNLFQNGVLLNAGTLVVGSNRAMGTGTLAAAANTTLDANTGATLGNAVTLAGNLNIGGTSALALNGVISGAGGLIKNGTADLILNGSNTFGGDVTLNAGRLVLGDDGALSGAHLTAAAGSTLDSNTAVSVANGVTVTGAVNIGGNADLTLAGVVDGTGGLVKNGAANLTLNGVSSYQGGTTLNGGTLTLGHADALGGGAFTVGGDATLRNGAAFALGKDIALHQNLTVATDHNLDLQGTISGTGGLTKAGGAELTLSGNNTFSGKVDVAAGTLNALESGALGHATSVNVASGAALNLGTSTALDTLTGGGAVQLASGADITLGTGNHSSVFAGSLVGSGTLFKTGSGELALTGTNLLSGHTEVQGGTLNVSGSLTSDVVQVHGGATLAANGTLASDLVQVHGGATLAANGTLTGAVQVADGGHLAVNTANSISMGSLAMAPNANLDVQLSTPGNTPRAAITVNGDLSLDGKLNVNQTAGFATGVYRLVNYAGTLSGNGLQIGTVTGGLAASDLDLQTAEGSQVNLVVGGSNVLFWNGTQTASDGTIKGGSGTWDTLGSNWTTLNGADSHNWAGKFAVFQGDAGTVTVNDNLSVNGMQFLTDGYSIVGTGNGQLNLAGSSTPVRVDPGVTATLGVQLTGSGQLHKMDAGTLVLNGANTYSGGTTLNGGTVVLGNNSALGTGAVVANAGNSATTVRNTQTRILNNTFVVDGNLSLETNNELQLVGALNGSGTLTKTGSDEVLLLSGGNFNGDIDVKGGYVTAVVTNALGDLRSASLAAGAGLTVDGNISIGSLTGQGVMRITNGQVSIGGSNLDSVFAGTVTANGGFNKVGAGVLELTGTSDHTGVNTVSAGTLKVTGALNGAGGLNVNAGATLTGSGSINGTTTIADGATLAGYSGQTLSFNNLVLSQDSAVNFNLGSPLTGAMELFKVSGGLSTAGTFNFADLGGLGNGVYKLFSYGGSLTDNGVTFGTVPTGVDVSELTLLTGTANQVNLLVSSPNLVMQFWDGVDTTSNGLIEGGSGVWNSTAANWVEHDGFGNLDWRGNFAVFQGATGTVTVEGQQTVAGMQFMTNGYHLVAGTNGSLNINNRNGTAFAVRTDAGVTATLDLPLTGTGTLNKLDVGTLVLNGNNSYTGGTQLNGGTLVLGSDSALGHGALTTAAGTTLDSNQAVTIINDVAVTGALTLAGSNDLRLNGVVSGSGSLVKNGNGFLTLGGVNTFQGGVQLNAGRLILGTDGSLGVGALTAANGTSLDTVGVVNLGNTVNLAGALAVVGSSDLTLNGQVNGAGSLLKQGGGTLTLNSANTFSGGLNLQAGTLNLGNADALGSGTLTVSGISSLDAGTALTVTNKVLLDADLAVEGSHALFLEGKISGAKGLIKNGDASLVLNAANDFAGGVTVNAGSVKLGNSKALGSGTLSIRGDAEIDGSSAMDIANDIAVGGTLSLAGNKDLTLSGTVSGQGRLVKNGTSTDTLAGVNNYLRDIDINAGTLHFSGATSQLVGGMQVAGNAHLSVASNAMVNIGGVLALDNASELSISAHATGASVHAASAQIGSGVGFNLTGISSPNQLDQVLISTDNGISGDFSTVSVGGFAGPVDYLTLNTRKSADNTQYLATYDLSWTAKNNLAHGGFTLAGATEQFEVAVALGDEAANPSTHWDGKSLTKSGDGTLVLSGANSYTGTTTINGGTLQIGNGGTSGNLGTGAVVNNGTLAFNRSDAISVANLISGSGAVSQTGAGVLTLSGANSYSGGTSINAGTLVAAHNSALGTGNVTVGNAAALEVASGTTLAVGSLDFLAGSTYRVNVDPSSGASSRIDVAGTANLAGNVLHVGTVSNAATDFQVGKTYTILHAGQVNGTFSAAESNYAYLNVGLDYLKTNEVTTDVTLTLARKGSSTGGGNMGFAELADTRNQSAAANAISSMSSSSALYQFVEKLPAGTPAAVLASLSGEVQATVGSSLVGLGAFAPGLSSKHLLGNLTAGMRSGAPVAQSDGPLPASAWPSSKALPAWAEVVGHWQRYDGDGNAAQLKQRTTGLFLGMDEEVGTSGWRVGGSVGYTNADGRVADRSSESDVNSYSAAVYGGKSFGTGTGPRLNVLGGLAYTWHDIETTRRVTSLGQTLKADYSAHTAQLFAEVGYAIGQYDKVGFEPFAAVSLGQQRTGSFQERGGFAALQGRSSTDDLASTTLGVRVHSDFQLAGKEGRLRATVGWRHAFGDMTAKKTMAFEGGQNFTVAGTPLARNTAVLGLEADVALSRSAALVLGYQGEVGSGQRDHSASVKLRWAF